MRDPATIIRAASNTSKLAGLLKDQWELRTRTRAGVTAATAHELTIKAQIEEVFLVLAHLGEAVLPLGVFNKDYYLQTLGEVQASISSCSHEMLSVAWAELDSELQYACTAGLTICACYSPMPVYRGFGACVLGDWDWACPDMNYLEEKAKKAAIRTIYGFKQKVDPQPMKAVFTAFDQTLQILQVKGMAFLEKRPPVSSFEDNQPRFSGRPKKDIRDDLELFEDWIRQIERRGHPLTKQTRLSGWGMPHATWTSPHSCTVFRTRKDCETIMCNQMDPGRLLHAFVCRGSLNLDVGQVLLLLPRSPAESLANWLEGLPGTSHKIVRWEDLDTEYFESKIPKSLRKKIGRQPLPTQYAIRHPQSASGPTLSHSPSSTNVLEHPNTVSPPPYSPNRATTRPDAPRPPMAELDNPDPTELPASPIVSSVSSPRHSVSLPVPGTGSSALKSIHTVKRKAVPGSSNPSLSPPSERSSGPVDTETQRQSRISTAVELPESSIESAAIELPAQSTPKEQTGLPTAETASIRASSASDVLTKAGESENASAKETPTVMVSEPEELTACASQTKGNENSTDTSSDANASSLYLELLNKVAKGEVSPQTLKEMLAKGNLSPMTDAAQGETKTESTPVRSSSSEPVSFPYPTSPIERQKNEGAERSKPVAGAPYLETPTDGGSEEAVEAGQQELPSSSRLGPEDGKGKSADVP